VSELLAAPLIEAAQVRYPEVRIRVVEAMSGYILDFLRRGEVDLAIIYSSADPRGLAFHALSEEICLFARLDAIGPDVPRGDVFRTAELAALPLILPGPGHGLRELVEEAAQVAGQPLRPAVEIDSYGQIKKLVQRGIGFGILPRDRQRPLPAPLPRLAPGRALRQPQNLSHLLDRAPPGERTAGDRATLVGIAARARGAG
jgi:LysR family transcriptional regulator, nitrogen assimilation regulatory protein